jgi:hypothetical protein
MKRILVILVIVLGVGLATEQITGDDLQKVVTSSPGLIAIGGVCVLMVAIWAFGGRAGR